MNNINEHIKVIKRVFNDLYFLEQDYRTSRDKLYDLNIKDERNHRKSFGSNYNKKFTLDISSKFWTVKHMIDGWTLPKPRLRDIPHLRDSYVLCHIIVDKYGKTEIKKHISKKDIEYIKNLQHTDFRTEEK